MSAVELSISDCFSNKDLIANQDQSINNRTSRFRPLTSRTIRAIQSCKGDFC
jgi:hypothetical protein